MPDLANHSDSPIAFTSKIKGFWESDFALVLMALIIAIFYIICSNPGIGWRDGPEFAITPVYLDVSHPSGFPTYNLLAKIFTWLPFGALALKITIFTALAGGASLFLFALLLRTLHNFKDNPAYLWLFAPLVLFAVDKAVFLSSTELEVYSLNTAFLLVLLFCATKWRMGKGIAWLYSGAFIYGIACGNHAALSLYLPILLMLSIWGGPQNEQDKVNIWSHFKRVGALIPFFILGLSVYLLLIIRSQTNHLPFDFGRTNTLSRFWLHISDAKDAPIHFYGLSGIGNFSYLVKLQFKNLCSPLFWLALPFFAWGLRYLWRTFQILSVALPTLILINFVFFYYWVDGSSAFIPSITVFFLIVALGLGELGRILNSEKFSWLKENIAKIAIL
ncbi:MAG: DUF2723 domain-containing protein, partial [Deltaproteobacteria bacterium]|nr:DUF2723 domain-containing protein [Deltaproteobacteria bacterium]